MALETPSRPPPFMAKAILHFPFDYLKLALRIASCDISYIDYSKTRPHFVNSNVESESEGYLIRQREKSAF